MVTGVPSGPGTVVSGVPLALRSRSSRRPWMLHSSCCLVGLAQRSGISSSGTGPLLSSSAIFGSAWASATCSAGVRPVFWNTLVIRSAIGAAACSPPITMAASINSWASGRRPCRAAGMLTIVASWAAVSAAPMAFMAVGTAMLWPMAGTSALPSVLAARLPAPMVAAPTAASCAVLVATSRTMFHQSADVLMSPDL